MSQERTFQLRLKNDQIIELKFKSIDATNNQLWQMFATTESLDMVERLVGLSDLSQTSSAKKIAPTNIASASTGKSTPEKSVVPKKKK